MARVSMWRDRYAQGLSAAANAGTWPDLGDAVRHGLRALGASGVAIGVLNGGRIEQTAYGFAPGLAESYADLDPGAVLPGPACVQSGSVLYLHDRRSTTDAFPAAVAILDRSPYEAAACLPLVSAGGRPLGYLAAHYRGARRFDEGQRFLLEALAACCTGTAGRLALTGSPRATGEALAAPSREQLVHQVEGLRTAMVTRGTIEQAKGILMERFGVSSEVAWQVLRRYSSHSNQKLNEVAARIVATQPVEPAAAPVRVVPR